MSSLPAWVVQGCEHLQVLRYDPQGHYACHHDSSPALLEQGESVRLATIALFLNKPTSGGEIAFPAAGHPHGASYNETDWSDMETECQPTPQCTQMGGVTVKPKKGEQYTPLGCLSCMSSERPQILALERSQTTNACSDHCVLSLVCRGCGVLV